MNNESQQEVEISHSYCIELPIDSALQVRDGLEKVIWEIAEEEGVEELLRKANFTVRSSEPAIDAGVIISVVVTYIGSKVLDKATGKVLDKTGQFLNTIWLNKILPKIRQRLGSDALVDEGESLTDE